MRLIALFTVMAIGLSILTPAGAIFLQSGPPTASIQTLDVCHSSITGISPDLPYINECPCQPLPLTLNEVYEIVSPPFKPLLITFQDERPPKV